VTQAENEIESIKRDKKILEKKIQETENRLSEKRTELDEANEKVEEEENVNTALRIFSGEEKRNRVNRGTVFYYFNFQEMID